MLTQIVLDTLNDPATAEIRRPLLITGAVARTDGIMTRSEKWRAEFDAP